MFRSLTVHISLLIQYHRTKRREYFTSKMSEIGLSKLSAEYVAVDRKALQFRILILRCDHFESSLNSIKSSFVRLHLILLQVCRCPNTKQEVVHFLTFFILESNCRKLQKINLKMLYISNERIKAFSK